MVHTEMCLKGDANANGTRLSWSDTCSVLLCLGEVLWWNSAVTILEYGTLVGYHFWMSNYGTLCVTNLC